MATPNKGWSLSPMPTMTYEAIFTMNNAHNLIWSVACSAFCLAICGCHLRPNLGPPGTIGMQRERAVLHDPYPNNDLGPAIVGGRPLGYDLPQSEPKMIQDTPYARRGARATRPTGF